MHDTDRILTETGGYEGEPFEFAAGYQGETNGGGVLSEIDEVDLASQFLEIQDEQELDQFLGNFFSRVKKFIASPTGQAITNTLKSVARQYLPMARQAVESRFGPAAGQLLGAGASALGLETGQDMEFEMAKKFVRFANEAIQTAAAGGPAGVRTAVVEAARKHIPEVLQRGGAQAGGAQAGGALQGSQSGRWVRTRRGILLLGV